MKHVEIIWEFWCSTFTGVGTWAHEGEFNHHCPLKWCQCGIEVKMNCGFTSPLGSFCDGKPLVSHHENLRKIPSFPRIKIIYYTTILGNGHQDSCCIAKTFCKVCFCFFDLGFSILQDGCINLLTWLFLWHFHGLWKFFSLLWKRFNSYKTSRKYK